LLRNAVAPLSSFGPGHQSQIGGVPLRRKLRFPNACLTQLSYGR